MIKIYYNPSEQAYEVYVNGAKVGGLLSVRIDTANDFTQMPKATINAMVEIVNEIPVKNKNSELIG